MTFRGVNIKDSQLLEEFKKWIKLDVITQEEQWQNTSSVINIFTVYNKLWRIPKLISKLLTAIDEIALEQTDCIYFQRGYVDVSVLEAFARCMQTVPFSQVLEIWEIFIASFERQLASLHQKQLNYGSTFIISQFFSTFLLHAQIFEEAVLPVIQEKISLLLIKTYELIENISSLMMTVKDGDFLKLSLLLIVYTYNETKLVVSIYDTCVDSKPKKKDKCTCCELKMLPFHATGNECNLLNMCSDFFKAQDKRLGYIAFKLLIHEVKANLIEKNPSSDKVKIIKSIVSSLIEVTLSATSECCLTEWDFNMGSINSTNFGVAYWNLFLSHLHLFIRHMSDKNLVLLCSAILEILVNDIENRSLTNSTSIQHSILKFVSSNFFMESRQFQIAFITAIWKHATLLVGVKKRSSSESDSNKFDVTAIFQELHSSRHKWEKYSLTTPKASEEMNTMWTTINTAAGILNKLLEASPSLTGKLKHRDVKNLLKVLNFLPLEHLLPGNQVRCMLGLSTMLFLHSNTRSLSENRESVQNILELLIAIFESVRSIWIFDFVHSIPYIKAVIYFMEQLHQLQFTGDLEICKKLLENIFKSTSKNAESLTVFEDYLPELISHMQESQVSTVAFLCLLQRLIELLQRFYLPAPLKDVAEKLANTACSSIVKAMHHWEAKDNADLKIYLLLLSCYESLIKLIVNPNCKFKENKVDKWLKYLKKVLTYVLDNLHKKMNKDEEFSFLSFICTVSIHRSKLNSHIPDTFSSRVWKFLRSSIFQKMKNTKERFVSPINEIEATAETSCFLCCNNHFSVEKEFDFETFIRTHILKETITEALIGITQTSSEEEFNEIFRELSAEVETLPLDIAALNAVDFVVTLLTITDIYNSATNVQHLSLMSRLIKECFIKLSFLINQTCSGKNCLQMVTIPSLNFIISSLRKGKHNLPRQCVVQCLYICTAVKAENVIDDPVTFSKVYNALWCTLNELLNHHSSFVILSIPALIPCVTHLLKLIIKASNQDLMLTYNDDNQREILICVQNFDKLIGLLIKEHKVELAKVVPYVIADYLDLVQDITIYPPAKVTFILTVNKMLDICGKNSSEMLAVNIKHSCREILNTLLKNYRQTRFSGQI